MVVTLAATRAKGVSLMTIVLSTCVEKMDSVRCPRAPTVCKMVTNKTSTAVVSVAAAWWTRCAQTAPSVSHGSVAATALVRHRPVLTELRTATKLEWTVVEAVQRSAIQMMRVYRRGFSVRTCMRSVMEPVRDLFAAQLLKLDSKLLRSAVWQHPVKRIPMM